MPKRLDRELTHRGLARSRTAAARLVEAGTVRVNGQVAAKVSQLIQPTDHLEVGEPEHYVSRAAYKLVAALDGFRIEMRDRIVLDLGASTGGFTQVSLERGAREVIALDVGHDQLNALIRSDARVTVIEGENARYLSENRLNELLRQHRPDRPSLRANEIDAVVADLSFISLRHILPALLPTAPGLRDAVLLIKPQFEVGRQYVRNGIVTDHKVAAEVAIDIVREAVDEGWHPRGFRASPITGTHGNHEYLLWLCRDGEDAAEWEDRILSIMRKGAE
ncbi:MAG: TlyA family RNA methyltransferase [Gulosibacter sp.]|uniref:TlyA family RNA methyltransferase n=1 Tax=Gulosibacter sp. TaxID=2817531 RepID=UPI003F910675